jgi:hypothetical protein
LCRSRRLRNDRAAAYAATFSEIQVLLPHGQSNM